MEIHTTRDLSHMKPGVAGLPDQAYREVSVWHWFNLVSLLAKPRNKARVSVCVRRTDAAERAAGFLLHYLHRLQT